MQDKKIAVDRYFPVLYYINIPNLFTTLGLIFGITAYFYLSAGNLKALLVCLFLASLMDLIDGYLADKLNQQTRFGQYADSLVDFFICCIMPTLMVHAFVGNSFLLMISATFYCVCGLWRLAHFNVIAVEKCSHFTGLPVPGAMLLATMTIWAVVQYDFPVWLCTIAFFLTGLLMVSFVKLKKYGIWQKSLWAVSLVFFVIVLLS